MTWQNGQVIIYIYIYIFGLTTQGRSVGKCHISQNRCDSVMSCKMKSHNNHGKVVHRLYSSCISSI